ncbi:MAG: 6-phosphofructokinase [Oscillospiraceae bacterium]|jgi:6-phosphofructokinase 1|nr:6-phosphofructokinase [Oscillospiraceae bacterium]
MSILKGACVVAQSGGPTAVINASAWGAITAALENEHITRVLGAAHGILGVLGDVLYDMSEEDPAELVKMKHTPSSALGSCRYKLADPDEDDTDYARMLATFRKYNVRYFFYNGGNDSMDTCNKISKYCQRQNYECRIIGIPKTIDNDLYGTDHCPGYGSAAKYIATSCMEVWHDAHVYDTGMITILEIMGRHAGWLTGASALACHAGAGPDLIYLPEIPFDMEMFLEDVIAVYKHKGKVLVAASEGIKDSAGQFVAEYGTRLHEHDSFGHTQLGGLAATLAAIVKGRTGAKVRGIEFSLLQRCAAHCASLTDIEESVAAGRAAVERAVAGETDLMVAFRCEREGGYKCEIELLPLDIVANTEKKLPREWISPSGNGLEEQFIEYALPLIQGDTPMARRNGLPNFAKLRKVKAGA